MESLEARLEEERAAHRQALADLGSELSAAQELSRESADNNAAAAALSAEVTRLQASLARAQSRLQAAEDRAQVARATSTSAQLERDSCQRELSDLRSEVARLAAERREEGEAAREREEALLREIEALRSAGPYVEGLGADFSGLDLPDHVVRVLSAKEAEVVAAVQETELMAEALTALHDALDEATGQLRAHKQLTADAQRALGEAAAALEAAAGRERELLGQVSATEDGAREVISRLRGECEQLLIGAGAVNQGDYEGGSEWDRGESRLSMQSGSGSGNPYEARSRSAVHAANKASFLKVRRCSLRIFLALLSDILTAGVPGESRAGRTPRRPGCKGRPDKKVARAALSSACVSVLGAAGGRTGWTTLSPPLSPPGHDQRGHAERHQAGWLQAASPAQRAARLRVLWRSTPGPQSVRGAGGGQP